MKAVVADRGQVIIPKAIRDRMGIAAKTILDFREEGGRIVVEKISPSDVVAGVYGRVKIRKSTDQVMSDLRGKL